MAFALAKKSACGSAKAVQTRPSVRQTKVVCQANGRRELLGLGAALGLLSLAPYANASLTDDLLAKSAANKELNDKKRLVTSSANFARSRTVQDGTCAYPRNFFGCEPNAQVLNGGVKFIQDDADLECKGKDTGKCDSQVQARF